MIWYRWMISMERARGRLFLLLVPLLAAIVWVCADARVFHHRRPTDLQEAEAGVRHIRIAAEQYAIHHRGRCPPSLATLVEDDWLRSDAPDPWDTPYSMRCEPHPAFALEVRSAGPDRTLLTEDDLVLE